MELHFITSISKDYWYNTAKRCINTWKLPDKVTVYIDQQHGDLDWISEIPFNKRLLSVPKLKVDEFVDTAKVRKFWGKSCAQIVAVRNRESNERVIWLDSDIEQTATDIDVGLFDFTFKEPVAVMNSRDGNDCWESGVVIFNEANDKLGQFMKKYEQAWNDEDTLCSLWKPYDAQVLGYVAEERGYYNLCTTSCLNRDALEFTRYSKKLKHWINKDNKTQLAQK
jgi:hypothetical protein